MENMENMENIETTTTTAPLPGGNEVMETTAAPEQKVFKNLSVRFVATLDNDEVMLVDGTALKVEEKALEEVYDYFKNAFKQFQEQKIFKDNLFVASHDGLKVVRKDIIKKIELVFDVQEIA